MLKSFNPSFIHRNVMWNLTMVLSPMMLSLTMVCLSSNIEKYNSGFISANTVNLDFPSCDLLSSI